MRFCVLHHWTFVVARLWLFVAAQIAERIVEAVGQPFTVSAATASVTASVGIVVARGDRRTSEQLMHAADTAMYATKHSGKPGCRIV